MRPGDEHRQVVDSISGHFTPREHHYESASQSFGELCVRSIITLNAGVAVAYPTVAEVFVADADLSTVLWPTGTAVLGVVLGVLCAFIAYLNNMFAAHNAHYEMQLAILKADEEFDTNTFWRFRDYRTNTKEFYSNLIKRSANKQQICFYSALSVGILAMICFGVSIFWFASNLA